MVTVSEVKIKSVNPLSNASSGIFSPHTLLLHSSGATVLIQNHYMQHIWPIERGHFSFHDILYSEVPVGLPSAQYRRELLLPIFFISLLYRQNSNSIIFMKLNLIK